MASSEIQLKPTPFLGIVRGKGRERLKRETKKRTQAPMAKLGTVEDL